MLWLIYFIGILLDQLSKYLIQAKLEYLESIPLIPGIFHLTFVRNTGAAFSILTGKTWFFIGITFLALAFIFYLLRRLPRDFTALRIALAMLASGATGNLIDRMHKGWVVDFLDFRIWPIFNLADCLVVVAVAIILWYMLFRSKEMEPLFQNQGLGKSKPPGQEQKGSRE